MLIKVIDNATVDTGVIAYIDHKNPIEFIKIIKEVNRINIKGKTWIYTDCDFNPTFDYISIDVVRIFVDEEDEDENEFNDYE